MQSPNPRMQLIAALLMLSFSPAAWARLEKVIETDGTIEYVDRQTIDKLGDRRRIWTVQDLKKRGGQGELSFRRLLEFNCRNRQYQIVWIAGHSGHMAGGSVLGSGPNPSPSWLSISNGSAAEASLKVVCGFD